MPTWDPQDSSLFFQWLPPEIRLMIYKCIFRSTRLSFGKRPAFLTGSLRQRHIRLRPAPNSLSVFRVCRRMNDDIGDTWLGQVLFSFHDPRTMLDKLAGLDRQTLGKLRHMRYSCDHLLDLRNDVVREDGSCQFWMFQLEEILKLLPGLRLDRLTVTVDSYADKRIRQIDDLLSHSDGWKELCFLAKRGVVRGSQVGWPKWHPDTGLFETQLSSWTQALAARDGPTASVTIYRSSDAALPGSMMSKPGTRQVVTDQIAEPGKEYGVESDTTLSTPGEGAMEILVVARRGKGVDYTETGTSPMMKRDIRKHWPGMTWGQIRHLDLCWETELMERDMEDEYYEDLDQEGKGVQDLRPGVPRLEEGHEMHFMPPPEHRPSNNGGTAGAEVDEYGCPIMEDTYKHVDDYELGAYHQTATGS